MTNQIFIPGMIENFKHQSSEVSSILNFIIFQNHLLPQLPEIVFFTLFKS